jgi:hypothetical protein
MSKIKPCPFCGKEQSENNFFSCDGYPEACGCWEKTHTGQEAIDVWNTRPIEDTLRTERDEWKADAERLAKLIYEEQKLFELIDKNGNIEKVSLTLDGYKRILDVLEQHRALVEKE